MDGSLTSTRKTLKQKGPEVAFAKFRSCMLVVWSSAPQPGNAVPSSRQRSRSSRNNYRLRNGNVLCLKGNILHSMPVTLSKSIA